MSQNKFQKPALSVNLQLELLQLRDLYVPNSEFAIRCLQTVSYYRLSVYCKPYQNNTHKFNYNTSFNMIWDLYSFDRELRLLMIDAIERIEIAFRTVLSNNMCLDYDQFWYLNNQNFKDSSRSSANFHAKLIKVVDSICKQHKEDFLQHFYTNYSDDYPPFWMMAECLSFGTISLIFKNLKHMKDKNNIARKLGYHATIIESWIESLVLTRNICAHHARLWNKWFVFRPQLPHNIDMNNVGSRHRIYEQVIILKLLLKNICPDSDWAGCLFKLLNKYQTVPKSMMGFSDIWQEDRVWSL